MSQATNVPQTTMFHKTVSDNQVSDNQHTGGLTFWTATENTAVASYLAQRQERIANRTKNRALRMNQTLTTATTHCPIQRNSLNVRTQTNNSRKKH